MDLLLRLKQAIKIKLRQAGNGSNLPIEYAGFLPYFDLPFYEAQIIAGKFEDTLKSDEHPIIHYFRVGANLGLDPNCLFDTSYYLENYRDVRAANQNPLMSFVMQGSSAGREPHPFFDTVFYKAKYPLVTESKQEALLHYLNVGYKLGYSPHPLFDPKYYCQVVGAQHLGQQDPLSHYLTIGIKNGVLPHPEYNTRFEELNDKEADKTIFIIGAGPQLAELTSTQIEALNNRVTIGLNRTNYKLKLKYFLSGYTTESFLARRRDPNLIIVTPRPQFSLPLVEGTIAIKQGEFNEGVGLPRSFTRPVPILHTRLNAALSAAHLALILGAKKIVFVGVEQRSEVHYYNIEENIRDEIIKDYRVVLDENLADPLYDYTAYKDSIEYLMIPLEKFQKNAYYTVDHAQTFKSYLEELQRHGIETISTREESVVSDAGARYVSLDQVLQES